MQRRKFPGVLGGAAVAWPRAIHAHEAGRIYRLGLLTTSLKIAALPILAFFGELRVFGFDRPLTEGFICRRALE
jgi:hypothetical protein